MHLKYVDDMTIVNGLNLKHELNVAANFTKPVQYHQRTGHAQSDDLEMKKMLSDIEKTATDNLMKIDTKNKGYVVQQQPKI